MLKKAITFTDFDGVEHTEDHYFNITKAELIELELTAEGNSFVDYVRKVVESNNGRQIMDVFKGIIFKAYGEKSEDGKRFVKSEKISEDFSHTAAYDVLFVELVTDAEASAKFINALMPEEVRTPQTAEEIKAASRAAMQGFNKKDKAKDKSLETVPDLPAAEPVLDAPVEVKAAQLEAPDYGKMTREELIALAQK